MRDLHLYEIQHINADLADEPIAPVETPVYSGEVPGFGYPDWPQWCNTYNERKAYQAGIADARRIAALQNLEADEHGVQVERPRG